MKVDAKGEGCSCCLSLGLHVHYTILLQFSGRGAEKHLHNTPQKALFVSSDWGNLTIFSNFSKVFDNCVVSPYNTRISVNQTECLWHFHAQKYSVKPGLNKPKLCGWTHPPSLSHPSCLHRTYTLRTCMVTSDIMKLKASQHWRKQLKYLFQG